MEKCIDEILQSMPDKPGFEKHICGAEYHYEKWAHELSEVCPACKKPLHPLTWYAPKDVDKDGIKP